MNNWKFYAKGKQGDKRLDKKARKHAQQLRAIRKDKALRSAA